jgi:hypothetical protein
MKSVGRVLVKLKRMIIQATIAAVNKKLDNSAHYF